MSKIYWKWRGAIKLCGVGEWRGGGGGACGYLVFGFILSVIGTNSS